jgi:hypothetical protein
MRYTYLGDKLTDQSLKGIQCNPIRRADGKCIVSMRMGSALVETEDGQKIIVNRRRLRLNVK